MKGLLILFAFTSLGAAAVPVVAQEYNLTPLARAWATCMWEKDPAAAQRIADGKLNMYVDDSAMGAFWARVTCRVPKTITPYPENAHALRQLIIRGAPKAASAPGNI